MYASKQSIIDEMVTAKNADPVLASLNSTSTTAIWKKWIDIVAGCIWNFDGLIEKFKTEIVGIVQTNQVGRADWYVIQALNFQYGDSLEYIDNVYKYAVIDDTKKIIKRASYQTETLTFTGIPINSTVIKVATEDTAGSPIPLDNTQLTAFNAYMQANMFAGSYISTRSQATDLMKLYATIYYDALFDSASVKANVVAAIDNYLKTLPFNAEVLKNEIIEMARAVSGVDDFEITTAQVKQNAGAYTTLGRSYIPFAGYIGIDPAFPLNTTLTLSL